MNEKKSFTFYRILLIIAFERFKYSFYNLKNKLFPIKNILFVMINNNKQNKKKLKRINILTKKFNNHNIQLKK